MGAVGCVCGALWWGYAWPARVSYYCYYNYDYYYYHCYYYHYHYLLVTCKIYISEQYKLKERSYRLPESIRNTTGMYLPVFFQEVSPDYQHIYITF